MREKPLHGVRVLDLTRLLPGPICTLHLGDMGADVIKIEDTDAGDYARWQEPLQAVHSPYFLCVNRHKRSVALNLRSETGRDIFLALARDADVVVEGFRPGVVDRLGIGYEAVREINPADRILCHIGLWAGRAIPLAGWPRRQLLLLRGRDGPDRRCGRPARGPELPDRGRSGRGRVRRHRHPGRARRCPLERRGALRRHIHDRLHPGARGHRVHQHAGPSAPTGTRRGFISGELPCYNIYETADGRYVSLGALEEKFWYAFCDAVARPDLKDRHIVSGAAAQAAREEVAELFRSRTRSYWIAVGEEHDCCLAPVLTIAEAMENPQFEHRKMFIDTEHPTDGPIRQVAFPIKFSDDTFTVGRHAPGHGEHTGGSAVRARLHAGGRRAPEDRGRRMSEPRSFDDEDEEPFVKPAFEYIRVRVNETFNRELPGPAMKAAEDIWKNWTAFATPGRGRGCPSDRRSVLHSVRYPSLSNFHMYRGAGVILLGTGAVTAVVGAALASLFGPVLWQGALICLAIGAGAFFWGRYVQERDTRAYRKRMVERVALASGGRRDRRPLRRVPFGLHRVRGSARPDVLASTGLQRAHRQDAHRRRARPAERLEVIGPTDRTLPRLRGPAVAARMGVGAPGSRRVGQLGTGTESAP